MKTLIERLRTANRIAFGVHLRLLCPEIIGLCGELGFEWLFLDTHRTPLNPRQCGDLVRVATTVGMPCIVRVPDIATTTINDYLDSGALGVMAPHISSAPQAQTLVDAVRRSSAALVIAIIESEQGVAHLDAIMSVSGLDYLAVGPNDLGLSLGVSGGMAAPRIRALVQDTRARIARRGKPQVAVVFEPDEVQSAVTAGARMIAVPDVNLLSHAGRAFLSHGTSTVSVVPGG